ncbi:hypothetical protein EUTSA_v10009624mg [Eutrema salsugineum]|uniref:Uncharacterized protein n=1 Tax=Eutrema salsugineum TaxID=72664 RepID=V4KX67_EUTSA|nr:hypothetical protein EUTSA_v10009624mg [Eutrema salsugineum]
MNNFIIYMLIIAMYLSTLAHGCKKNKLTVRNDLGPGRILHFRCEAKNGKLYIKNLEFKTQWDIEFGDTPKEPMVLNCTLQQGLWLRYKKTFEAYKGPKGGACNQIREWIGRSDGLYLKINSQPAALKLRWT